MSSRMVDEIKWRMLTEYEDQGTLNVAAWLSQYPKLRDELLDFAFWIKASPHSSKLNQETWKDEDRIAWSALEEVRKGLQRETKEKELSSALAKARAKVESSRGRGRAPLPFRRATVLTWVFEELCGDRDRLERYTTHKVVYLVEQALDLRLFSGYRKKAAGPYDPSLRYKDAEPIAEKQGWIQRQGQYLLVGESISDVHKYAPRYLREERTAKEFVRYLSALSNAQLEVWTTVHMASQELLASHEKLTVEGVRRMLLKDEEWKAKFTKHTFSPENVADVLQRLHRLGLVIRERG